MATLMTSDPLGVCYSDATEPTINGTAISFEIVLRSAFYVAQPAGAAPAALRWLDEFYAAYVARFTSRPAHFVGITGDSSPPDHLALLQGCLWCCIPRPDARNIAIPARKKADRIEAPCRVLSRQGRLRFVDGE